MNKIQNIFLALMLTACSRDALTFAIDVRFSDNEVKAIEAATDEWLIATDSEEAAIFLRHDFVLNEPFDKEKHWECFDKDYGVIYKIYTSDPGYLAWMQEKKPFSGIARSPDRIALVHGAGSFYSTILHEFGHIFELEHQESGLMYYGKLSASCIDKLTLDLFCDIHECGPNAAPTCEE